MFLWQKREQKPIYINNDIFNGTFRRNYEGDYHCTRLQVKAMLRDQTERTMDMEILDKVSMEDLNYDTIHGYRNSHRTLKEGHPFERLNDHEYLRSIGAAAVSEEDGKLHPKRLKCLCLEMNTILFGIFQSIF